MRALSLLGTLLRPRNTVLSVRIKGSKLRWLLATAARLALLLIAVSFITFLLVGLSPIDPVQANVGQAAYLTMSAEKRAVLAQRWGVGQSVFSRYAAWASDALVGDFGYSLRYNAPVIQVVAEKLSCSIVLLAVAWVISGAVGFCLGVAAGVNRGTTVDLLIKGYCYVLSTSPTFWLGLIALMVFSVQLGWFPLGFSIPIGESSASVSLVTKLYHAALPALVLSLTGVASIALHTREKTIDFLTSDFARFAESRGESSWSVLVCHGLRNLAMPATMLQFASIGEIIGGSVLVEQVFSYPGLGQAAVTAGLGGDAPLLVGIALATSCLVFAGNLISNLIQEALDPRVKGGLFHAGQL